MDQQSTDQLARIAENAMREKGFIPYPPDDAVAEAAAARAPADAGSELKDLRALPWTSIDNPESQDLDQVEVAEKVAGGTRLYVGIADVERFVAAGGAIDGFAGNNTTSVYTGVRTFPMLPERLSFDLSSLLAGRVRAAVVIETVVTDDGTLAEGKVYPALIENRAKLDYPAISAWLDGKRDLPPQLAAEPTLRAQVELHEQLAKRLADQRRREGALDVDTAQMRAVLDDQGKVVGFAPHHQDRAGSIIEELMIASNRTVAKRLDAAGVPSLRRVVKAPERWAKIVAYAGERGTMLPPEPSSLALAKFVDAMRATRAAEFGEISLALVKMMGRGEYVAHAPDQPDIGHFGLATAAYTHATAPNRRYPDLITQRLVKGLRGPAAYDLAALTAIAARCSAMEAAAEKVERRVQKSAAAMLLGPRIGQTFDGVITGATPKGTFVRVFEPVAEGKVVRGDRGLKVGDHVRVRLTEVDVDRGFVDFVVA